MATVVAARDAYLAARRHVETTRLALGKAIADARAVGTEQSEIARQLGLTREQIRRYEEEYRRKS